MSSSVVIDASVVLKLFGLGEERHQHEAELLLEAKLERRVTWSAPSFLRLEVLNVLARKRHLHGASLGVAIDSVEQMDIRWLEPDFRDVVTWAGRGLSAYDASYVALAERRGELLVTDDGGIVDIVGNIALPLNRIDELLQA